MAVFLVGLHCSDRAHRSPLEAAVVIFDGEGALPDGLSQETIRRLAIDNPLDTFPRLREGAQMSDNAAGHEESVR